uniref:Adenylyltransferase and sulfurtransferase MOCS3 homolog n=1 Tax=Parastrongyloides trichosuri TaxID=131310 RepID=A0A0N4ZP91_PARTI
MNFICPLSKDEVSRFSRQLILRGFGVEAQKKLHNGSVLIVGAGGLGCPVAMYVAASGIGKIGIVDHDEVSLDNIHRQVCHKEKNVGMNKCDSLKEFIKSLNSSVVVETFNTIINSNNVKEIMEKYDLVADCSDNVVTRYLLNDASIFYKKILVSGSALGWEGQLTTYNYNDETPCYRCILPVPPPSTAVVNCNEGGVLGPIVGMIGSMEALEIIKILGGLKPNFAGKMFVFDGMEGISRKIKLRGRKLDCPVCSNNPTITKPINYELFCGSTPTDKILKRELLKIEDRITVNELVESKSDYLLIDCRPAIEFAICHLEKALNIPLDEIEDLTTENFKKQTEGIKKIYIICHRGNDSQLAVNVLKKHLKDESIKDKIIKDVIGGLEAWNEKVDKHFPTY